MSRKKDRFIDNNIFFYFYFLTICVNNCCNNFPFSICTKSIFTGCRRSFTNDRSIIEAPFYFCDRTFISYIPYSCFYSERIESIKDNINIPTRERCIFILNDKNSIYISSEKFQR